MHKKKYNTSKKKSSKVELNPSDERLTSYALWMLGRQDYTANKLREKMRMRFPESTEKIEKTINDMIEMDYINDQRYLHRLVEHHLASGEFGPAAIKNKLFQKGFNKSDIDEAMAQEHVSNSDFFEKALAFKIKQYGELPITDPKEKQRALGKLVRKGFGFQDALKAIDAHTDELDNY